MRKRSKFAVIDHLGMMILLLVLAATFQPALAEPLVLDEPPPYVESALGPRFYLGDEDTRLGRAHFVHGDYGLAETYFRRAVEAMPKNGAAWVGLAAAYDRLARFDLAERAYRRAVQLQGPNFVILNNHGYSYLLRGNVRMAQQLLFRAAQLAPANPVIMNNLAILQSGQAYFEGDGPYIWGWWP